MDPIVWQMFLRFVDFWETHNPTLIETEVHLFSDELKIAGTCDCICEIDGELWVIDFKTSNHLHTTYELQSAAYAQMYKECFGQTADRIGILWLKSKSRGIDRTGFKIKGKKDYKLLSLQMENLFRGIESANPNDLIIFSDEDEIPNPKIIANYDFEKYKYGIFLQNMYYYKLNIMNIDEGNNNWPGPRICLKKNLKSFFKLRLLKVKNINYPFWRIDKEKSIQLIKTGGWHFTYLMKPKEIAKKIEDMAHTEFNKPEFKDISFIENNIKKLNDPFNRNLKLKKVEIDDSYPVYIQKNKNFFNEWILE